jgi:hypothetical protein
VAICIIGILLGVGALFMDTTVPTHYEVYEYQGDNVWRWVPERKSDPFSVQTRTILMIAAAAGVLMGAILVGCGAMASSRSG